MKSHLFAFAVACALAASASAQRPVPAALPDPAPPPSVFPKPIKLHVDLIVPRIALVGPRRIAADGAIEQTVDVTVRNQGNLSAGAFKTAVEYTLGAQTYVVAFTVAGQLSPWYPWISTLAAGAEVTMRGRLTFHPSLSGAAVAIRAHADSCSGDEFMPAHCRVRESNESNNRSTALPLAL